MKTRAKAKESKAAPICSRAAPPTILYVDCTPDVGIDGMRLAGLRRYASARKWCVETLEHKVCSPEALRDALARLRPIGCAAECVTPQSMPPALFGRVPVVYFGPQHGPRWRNARGIECDNASVARLAFKELSASKPPAYAVVSLHKTEVWARDRINAFRDCCRNAGFDCPVSYFPVRTQKQRATCVERMIPWVAALPHRCAVFTVNDYCARNVARALAALGRSFPRTITLVGADGAGTYPELAETISTIRLDFELAGYLAAKMIGAIAGGVFVPPGTTTTFPPLMVARRRSTLGYGRREPRILKAIEIIRSKACEGLTVAKLASRFEGSRRLFEMRFREAIGHSALDEIMNVRLERAMDLLAHSDMPIEAVAHFSGFKTTRELWRHVLKQTGMSPMLFRKARK